MRALLCLAVIFASSCSRPRPPTISPEKAAVTSIGPNGITLDLGLAVDNPNGIELAGRSVTARVKLESVHDLGTVSIPQPFTLPPRGTSHIVVPLSLKWADVSLLFSLAAANRPISYDIDGTVNVGGDVLNAEVPFHMTGVITHEQMVNATFNSIPPIIPR